MKTRITYDFYKDLAGYGIDLLQDPLSEVTRNRQSSLLISSVAALLLSFALVSPTEGSLGGLTVAISHPETIKSAAGLIALYFLIIYLVNVAQDLRIYRYRLMGVAADIGSLNNKLGLSIQQNVESLQEKSKANHEVLSEMQSLFDAQNEIDRKYAPNIDDIEKRIDSGIQQALPQINEGSDSAFWESMSEYKALTKALDEIERKKAEEKRPHIERLNELHKTVDTDEVMTRINQLHDATQDLRHQTELLLRAHQTRAWLQRLRIALEIIFPTALSLFGIYEALLA
jgi:hypothetical protein